MEPIYQDNWTTLFNADCREALKALPSESVNCVVTSPPFYGLRDYGTATWEGGSDDCQHNQRRPAGDTHKSATNKGASRDPFTNDDCRHCGATRIDSQIGLEQTPESYIAAIVDVFKEVWRVLDSSGVVFLNLGDSYNGSGKGVAGISSQLGNIVSAAQHLDRKTDIAGLKPKDLIGIPWMAAFALRSQGFYLRSDIIWSRPNPMPESVTDGPTKAHEYIFLLSKSQTYYYNADAIAETAVRAGDYNNATAQNKNYSISRIIQVAETRNKRSVWTVATKPYPESHFAVFPPELIKPCVLAGCPVGGTVLDPFAGSGTTLQVAMEQGCKSIGIELNTNYCKLIMKRMRQPMVMLPPPKGRGFYF